MTLRLLVLSLAAMAAPAFGQSSAMSCGLDNPTPRTVRAEGKSELVTDVVVRCTGGTPTSGETPIPSAQVTLTFNAAVTSKVLLAPDASEVLALVDEPPANARYACTESACVAFGNNEGTGYYGPSDPAMQLFGVPNVYQGTIVSPNSVTFTMLIDPPGDGTRVYRFTNIRLDPSTVASSTLQLSLIHI